MKLTDSPLNRRSCATMILLGAGLVLVVAAGLARSAPTVSNDTDVIFGHLKKVHSCWKDPCSANAVASKAENQTTGKPNLRRQARQTLKGQINQTLLELDMWRNTTNAYTTNWNTEDQMEKFRFLKPFKRDKRTAYNKLSVYWASLELISDLAKKSNVINSTELSAIDEVKRNMQQLLCQLDVYNGVMNPKQKFGSKNKHRPRYMARELASFNLQDPSELRIHIWYVMCRLDCFLTNMQKHESKAGGRIRKPAKGKGGRKPPCGKCPHKAGGPKSTQHPKKPRQKSTTPARQHTGQP